MEKGALGRPFHFCSTLSRWVLCLLTGRLMKKGSLRRRPGGADFQGPNELVSLPRPFADTSKLSVAPSRARPTARADLEVGRKRRVNLTRGLPARGYSLRSGPSPSLAKRRSVAFGFLRRQPRVFLDALRADPRVSFCVSRKKRREVLFALNRAGFRGSARKVKWKRSYNSQWRC